MARGRKILLSTFGFDASKVLEAMRSLPHDQLIVIVGQDAIGGPGFVRLRKLEGRAPHPMEVVTVDPFSFEDCFSKVAKTIQSQVRAGHRVLVNISGGTKLLADCALLAAYQHGVEVYHCEGILLRLPVIKGLCLAEMFTEAERAVLKELKAGDGLPGLIGRLAKYEVPEARARAAVRTLQKRGVLQPRLQAGSVRLFFAPGQDLLRTAILAE